MYQYKWYRRTYERFHDNGRYINSGEVYADNDTKAKRKITKETETAKWGKDWIKTDQGFKKYNGDARIDVSYWGVDPPNEQIIVIKS